MDQVTAKSDQETPRTSGLAITSLVMGVLGLCGITALVGIVCGIVAIVQISRSEGRLKGQGLAIAGLCLSGFFFLCLPGLLLPALAKAKAKAQRINCVNNLKQLALGVRMYSQDSKEHFPSGDKWCDAIASYVTRPTVFHCPAGGSTARCTYAFNARLSGMDESKINPSTVMLFEIEDGWNVSGGREDATKWDAHRGACNVALADGSVQQVTALRLSQLRWDP